MPETIWTWYEQDWPDARKRRDRAREDLMKGNVRSNGRQLHSGAWGLVRGEVQHPLYGRGHEVWFTHGGDSALADMRMLVDGPVPQSPPAHVATHEQYVAIDNPYDRGTWA